MSKPEMSQVDTARRADATCVGLAVALALWTALVAGAGDGRWEPIVVLLVGLSAAVGAGRRLARRTGLVSKVAAGSIAGAFALTYPDLLGAAGAPTGYANSNATLAGIGILAAVDAARRSPVGPERQAWTAIAAALVVAVLLTQSTAGIASLVVAGALVVFALRTGWAPVVAAGGAIAASLLLGFTVLLAVDGISPLSSSDLVRIELWSAAVDLAQAEPIRGLGAGAFEELNPVTGDADLRWVHHEYLELAVELGAVGLCLAVGLGLATFHRLSLAGADGSIAAAAVSIVALHGTVDHVWHAPAVLVLAALLVGGATGESRGR